MKEIPVEMAVSIAHEAAAIDCISLARAAIEAAKLRIRELPDQGLGDDEPLGLILEADRFLMLAHVKVRAHAFARIEASRPKQDG